MVLITGGMGFTGLHTARALLDAGESVVITRYRTWREPSFLKDEFGKRVVVESLDQANPFDCIDVVRKHRVESIIHLAVPSHNLSPAEDFRVNTGGLINILEAGRLNGVRRVSLASSSTVYYGVPKGPFREEMPLPTDSRIATEAYKKVFEIIGLHYAQRTGLDVIVLRVGGIFGPLYHTMLNLPSRMVHGALKGGKVVLSSPRGGEIPFAQDGHDFTYVKDIARGIVMAQMTPKLNHRVYNVTRGAFTSHSELREAVVAAVPDAQIELRPGHGPDYKPDAWLDITRLREDTGYTPAWPPRAAIADYVSWLKAGNPY
ncbi:MAG TPA: NAD(P)-dependent oxidoreductase [Candidatus Binataceae bacterium]|nr:NAD(P)-dependent oxidoreductase [Candidatus Binataceae bacterium]